jgi:hypothetical protein
MNSFIYWSLNAKRLLRFFEAYVPRFIGWNGYVNVQICGKLFTNKKICFFFVKKTLFTEIVMQYNQQRLKKKEPFQINAIVILHSN